MVYLTCTNAVQIVNWVDGHHANVLKQLHAVLWQMAEGKGPAQVPGLQQTLEAYTEGVMLVDTAKPDWSILYQNEAWLRITGMSRDEVQGSNLWQLYVPAGRTRVSLE